MDRHVCRVPTLPPRGFGFVQRIDLPLVRLRSPRSLEKLNAPEPGLPSTDKAMIAEDAPDRQLLSVRIFVDHAVVRLTEPIGPQHDGAVRVMVVRRAPRDAETAFRVSCIGCRLHERTHSRTCRSRHPSHAQAQA